MSNEAYEFLNSGGKIPAAASSTVQENPSGSATYNFFASGGKIPEDLKTDETQSAPTVTPKTQNTKVKADDLITKIPNPLKMLVQGAKSVLESPVVKNESGGYVLSDTVPGRALTGALGIVKGADDMIGGAAQLVGHAVADVYPSSFPGSDFLQKQADMEDRGLKESDENFQKLTSNTRESAEIGEFTGNVEAALSIPFKAGGANLFSRMIAAAKTGAAVGAITPNDPTENKQITLGGTSTPLTEDQNFWVQKAIDTGAGALAGFFGQPIVEGAVGLVAKTAKTVMNVGQRAIDWATGKLPVDDDIAKLVKNASPDIQQAVKDVKKGGKDVDPEALGRKLQGDSLPYKVQYTEGMAKQDAIKISEEMNTRSKNPAMVHLMEDNNKALINNLNHVRDTGAPDVAITDHITAGENLIKSGEGIIEKKAAETRALYEKLSEANGGKLPMDGRTFAETAEKSIADDWKEEYVPQSVKDRLNWLKRTDLGDKNQMTFKNFETFRTLLASESRKAERAGDGNTKHAIGLIRDALENTPVSSEVAGVKELADAARKSAKEGFDMIRNNPALQAIDSGKVADDKFIQKYIIGASKKELTNLASAMKDDPMALQTIKAGVVNYLKKSASLIEDSGNFGQSGYNKALQSLGPKLDVMFSPEEAAILRTVGNVSRDINLAPKGSYVNTSNTDVANYARTGAANAIDQVTGTRIGSMGKRVIESVVNKRSEKSRIAEMIGPSAGIGKESAANEFWNTLPRKAGGAAVIPISTLITRPDKKSAEERP